MAPEALLIKEGIGKTLEITDVQKLKQLLETISKKIIEKYNLEEKFTQYLKKFTGRAHLGEIARVLNRDLENAQRGDIGELTRKLDLTTISGAQESMTNFSTEAQTIERIEAQGKLKPQLSKAQTAKVNLEPGYAPFHIQKLPQ